MATTVNSEVKKKKRKRRPAYKVVERETSIAAAVEDGWAELISLRNELREWRDNISSKLSGTHTYQLLEEGIAVLSQHCDSEPDVPRPLAKRMVRYVAEIPSRRGRSISRHHRMDNTLSMLASAAQNLGTVTTRGASELQADLEQCVSDCRAIRFPSMFGS